MWSWWWLSNLAEYPFLGINCSYLLCLARNWNQKINSKTPIAQRGTLKNHQQNRNLDKTNQNIPCWIHKLLKRLKLQNYSHFRPSFSHSSQTSTFMWETLWFYGQITKNRWLYKFTYWIDSCTYTSIKMILTENRWNSILHASIEKIIGMVITT